MGRSYSDWSVGASVIDQLNDRVGVIVEVCGEIRIGEGIAVVGDGFLEVVGDGLGIRVAHAGWALSSRPPVGALARAPTAVAAS